MEIVGTNTFLKHDIRIMVYYIKAQFTLSWYRELVFLTDKQYFKRKINHQGYSNLQALFMSYLIAQLKMWHTYLFI